MFFFYIPIFSGRTVNKKVMNFCTKDIKDSKKTKGSWGLNHKKLLLAILVAFVLLVIFSNLPECP